MIDNQPTRKGDQVRDLIERKELKAPLREPAETAIAGL